MLLNTKVYFLEKRKLIQKTIQQMINEKESRTGDKIILTILLASIILLILLSYTLLIHQKGEIDNEIKQDIKYFKTPFFEPL